MKNCPEEFIRFAHELAELGGEVHRRYFRKSLKMIIKDDGSPVTQADLETELVLREALEREYPAHGIRGEEHAAVREDSEFVWLIDPIDGTQPFISGLPVFGLMICLAWQGNFIMGLIDQPILHERWIGADGHGTSLNCRQVRARKCRSLEKAVLHAGGPTRYEAAADAAIAHIRDECRGIHYGVECYDFGLLASGYIDIILAYDYEICDFAPLEPVVRNAGGMLTDWQGRRLRLDSDGHILAVGDPRLLAKIIKGLSGR